MSLRVSPVEAAYLRSRSHEGARELHGERHLGVPDGYRFVHLLRELEVPVRLAFRQPHLRADFVGGFRPLLGSPQQAPSQIEPLGLLDSGSPGHRS